MGSPKISTGMWRLPAKNRAGTRRAGRFDQAAYARLGLTEIVEQAPSEAVRARADASRSDTAQRQSRGGLMTVDTSGWGLSEGKKKRSSSEKGRKWDADPPEDRRGRKVLYSGDPKVEEPEVSHEEQVSELRRLTGLDPSRHLEFALGTPHRRMPSSLLKQRLAPVREAVEPGSVSRLPSEVRRLVEGRRSLPTGGILPQGRAQGSGILDPVTEDQGEAYIDRVLGESQWFLRDFRTLALGEEPKRGKWRGSGPDYSDELVDPDGETDVEDDDEDEDEMDEARRRIRFRHTGPGGRGKPTIQRRQSQAQHRRNISAKGRRAKRDYERSSKGRAARRKAVRLAKMRRHASVEEHLQVTPQQQQRVSAMLERHSPLSELLQRLRSR